MQRTDTPEKQPNCEEKARCLRELWSKATNDNYLKASSEQTMAAMTGYAAVLVIFSSYNPDGLA